MSIFDELFDFRLAYGSEIDKIMKFIKDYWGNPNHILANDKDFFTYEYCPFDRPNVYLAVDKKTEGIAAMHCLYFYSKEHIKGKTDMSTGMFLANSKVQIPLVGIELHKRVLDDLNPRSYIAPGVNVKTSAPLLKRFLHCKVEKMHHFYMAGNVENMRIGRIDSINGGDVCVSERQEDLVLYNTADEMYDAFDDEAFKDRMPYKDRWYVERRYFNHPIYRYKMYGITDKTVIVCREICAQGSKVLRIVDILGEVSRIKYAGKGIKKIILDNKYEYVDIYEQKMDKFDLKKAGFIELKEDDDNIVPNYFEPFVKKNIDIWVNRRDDKSLCFKADGDQDRPNYR